MISQHQEGVPLYRQIAYQLIGDIQTGVYKPGDKLPSENQLAAHYSVHRLTVRQAIGMIVEQGMAYRQQGRGTFVAQPRLNYGINTKTNFSGSLLKLGYLPSLKIINVQTIIAPEALVNLLEVSPNSILIELKVLRTGSPQITGNSIPEHEPLCISLSYLPLDKFPDLPNQIYQSYSLYGVLQKFYSIEPKRILTYIETEIASPEDADLLTIPAGSPLLITKATVQDQRQEIIEHTISRFRGDRFTLEVAD
ncbi:MAG: GntR family transcriptional regulator [Mastigocoleus sp. MO_167.B18]|nr:GntR family transcriptional regulator [Mastigocoleus sp. MO_167.B18]